MAFYLISHVVFQQELPIYGPVQVLREFLKSRKQKVELAFLPLYSEGKYIQTGQSEKSFEKQFPHMVFKYLYDMYFSFKFVLLSNPAEKDVVIAVDPLNCIGAVILKYLLGFRLIYYTADYSDRRFPQQLLNVVYQVLDQLCLRLSDENWCVSERIVAKRAEQGRKTGVHFVPNTPVLQNEKPQVQTKKYSSQLLYVGKMDEEMNLMVLLQAVKEMSSSKKVVVDLTLIGGGQLDKQISEFVKKYKLSKNIHFKGPQPNSEVIKQIKKSGIGIALYSGGHQWNQYGDSMKMREYQYFGLPVICTEIPSNASEVTGLKCGVVLSSAKLTAQKLIQAIKAVQKNYKQFTQNAHDLTLTRKKDVILQRLLEKYLESK